MTAKEAVLQEIESLLDELMPEVLDHVRLLKLRSAITRSGTALASETRLSQRLVARRGG